MAWLVSLILRILAGVPQFFAPRPAPVEVVPRIDACEGDGWFEVRVDAPGIDPTRDVDITASRRELSIEVRRARTTAAVDRSFSLPEKANPVDTTTTYDSGILRVWVPLSGAAHAIERPVRLPVTY
jgi:HSP20 family molecular chaperone IbpA